jgi:hypothetical protein
VDCPGNKFIAVFEWSANGICDAYDDNENPLGIANSCRKYWPEGYPHFIRYYTVYTVVPDCIGSFAFSAKYRGE